MDDLISRQAAIDALGGPPASGDWMDEWECGCRSQWEWDKEAIENVPSAQPQRMMGRWIEYPEVLAIADALDDTYIGCSCCKNVFNIFDNDTERFLFCPNCGARMDGGEQDDEMGS